MSSDTHILREYLVALGFRVDENQSRKFENKLVQMDKSAAALGKTLTGVAVAAVTLSTVFARGLEKMYYSARYADTTVGKLQALEFGMRNIGFEGGAATATLKSFAAALRANPGLVGLLEKLGVQVKGRTMDKVMLDFVKATKSMPSYVSQRYAQLFGMDPETLFNLQQGIDMLEEAARKRQQLAQDFGVDPDKTAEVAREYMNMWRDVTESAGLFGFAIGEVVLPKVKELVGTTQTLMQDWLSITREIREAGTPQFWKRIREGVGIETPGDGRVTLTEEQKRRIGAPLVDLPPPSAEELDTGKEARWKRLLKRVAPGMFGRQVAKDPDAVDAVTDNSDFTPARPTDKELKEALARQGKPKPVPAGKDAPPAPDEPVDLTPGTLLAQLPRPARPVRKEKGNPALEGDDLNVAGKDMPLADVPERPAPGPERAAVPLRRPPLATTPPSQVVVPDAAAGDTSPGGQDIPLEQLPDEKEMMRRRRAYLAKLEKVYALPKGLLDRSWSRESDRGRNMVGPKLKDGERAEGHFQFIPETAREYGLQNPYSFQESAVAAARKWSDLLKQYKGNTRMAAAAYNWGDGNLARYGLGNAPRETKDYMDAVAGPAQGSGVTTNTEIHVHGVSDPTEAANTVVRKQRDVNADLVRNLSPKVR